MAAVVFGPDRARPGSGGSSRRTALVLGAGGVLGAAWMTGALACLADRLPCPAGDVDLIVGTSAGSVLAAALRCQAPFEEMVAWQRGQAAGPLTRIRRAGRPGRPAAAAAPHSLRLGAAGLRGPGQRRTGSRRGWRPAPGCRTAAAGIPRCGPWSPGCSWFMTRRRRRPAGRPADLDRRGGLRHRTAGAVRAGRRPARLAGRRRGRLLLHSGLVRAPSSAGGATSTAASGP